MDFLDPKKRRQNDIMLMIGYVLVTIAVLMTTVVLIYYANGFGVSRDGSLTQRSLVFVSSEPTNSTVYVDGKKRTSTNTKLHLDAGAHNLKITRTGYYDWTRKIMVEGSGVDHYDYPQLIAKQLTPTPEATYESAPLLVTQSPDKRWLITQQTAGDTFAQYDLQKPANEVGKTESLVVPESLVSATTAPATWVLVEWSTNNRHIVLNRTYTTAEGQKHEIILIDRQRMEGSHNLTRELSLSQEMQVSLRNKNPDTYFVFDPATHIVSTASLGKPTLVPYQEHVLGYKTHGDNMMLYATDLDAAQNDARIILRDDKTSYFLRTVPKAETYLLDMAEYDGNWYVAAGSPTNSRVFLFKNPMNSIGANTAGQPKIFFAFNVQNPNQLSISATAQYIAVQNGTAFQVYDTEFNVAYNWKAPFAIDGPNKYAAWIDGHRFTYVSQGKQIIVEYDGLNAHTLVASDTALGGFFSNGNRVLYTFSTPTTGAKTQFLVTPLRTPADQ